MSNPSRSKYHHIPQQAVLLALVSLLLSCSLHPVLADADLATDADRLPDADADEEGLLDSDLPDALDGDLDSGSDADQPLGFRLLSSAFEDGGELPALYACADDFLDPGVSPPLAWFDAPPDTESFGLVVTDREGGFLHWAIAGIGSNVTTFAEGISPASFLPEGAWELENDFGIEGYGGPCPPPGELHVYDFELSALDVELPDPGEVGLAEALELISIHRLDSARLSARYEYRP